MMIYLDNGATSWPKPQEVKLIMNEALDSGGNPGRGGHGVSMEAARSVYRVRELLARLFGIEKPTRVVFTYNATQAINTALFGILKSGDHVITSSLEHNAVTRPLNVLENMGVKVTRISGRHGNEFSLEEYAAAFRDNTKLVVTLHASNVSGVLLPVEQIGKIAKNKGVPYLLDAAQTAGVFPLDLNSLPVDILAFPGHKGLLGPQGTGGLVIGDNCSLRPFIYGGTGSLSELDSQPDFLPDALESGTLNGVGIAGLGGGIKYLLAHGLDNVRKREQQLCQYLIDGLLDIPGVKLYGGTSAAAKAPIVAFNLGEIDSMIVGDMLDEEFGVICRAGLHCAPHAHRMLGTIEQGVVRLSPSHFTTEVEIAETLKAVAKVSKELF